MEGRKHGQGGGGVGMPGSARLARTRMCPPAKGAGGGQVGGAGSPIARGCCGSCFTCSSRAAAIPLQAAMWSHASVNALWRATTLCHDAPQVKDWVPPNAIGLPQTHASSPF